MAVCQTRTKPPSPWRGEREWTRAYTTASKVVYVWTSTKSIATQRTAVSGCRLHGTILACPPTKKARKQRAAVGPRSTVQVHTLLQRHAHRLALPSARCVDYTKLCCFAGGPTSPQMSPLWDTPTTPPHSASSASCTPDLPALSCSAEAAPPAHRTTLMPTEKPKMVRMAGSERVGERETGFRQLHPCRCSCSVKASCFHLRVNCGERLVRPLFPTISNPVG